jgi:hypothetical protein
MVLRKPQFIIFKSDYFQNAQKGECFFSIFQKAFSLVRERRFRALVLQNVLRPHGSARTWISRTTMRSRNIILEVVSSKKKHQLIYLVK